MIKIDGVWFNVKNILSVQPRHDGRDWRICVWCIGEFFDGERKFTDEDDCQKVIDNELKNQQTKIIKFKKRRTNVY